jgi:hypothetical protein
LGSSKRLRFLISSATCSPLGLIGDDDRVKNPINSKNSPPVVVLTAASLQQFAQLKFQQINQPSTLMILVECTVPMCY